MADEYQVPPPIDESADRVQGRSHESDFARLPDHETRSVTEPGAGPDGGPGTSGTNGPIVLMAIGALVAASVFVLQSPLILILGVAIFLGAALWAGIANRSPGTMGGSGPSDIDPEASDRP